MCVCVCACVCALHSSQSKVKLTLPYVMILRQAYGGSASSHVDAEGRDGLLRLDILWTLASRAVAIELSAHCAPGDPTEHGSVAGHIQRLAHEYLRKRGKWAGALGVFVHLSTEALHGKLLHVLSACAAACGGSTVHRVYLRLDAHNEHVLDATWWRPGEEKGAQVYPSSAFPRLDTVCTISST